MPETRDYIYYDHTISLCIECHRRINAKIIFQDDKVFLTKTCPDHGFQRVLIADDNPVNALIARRALESAGFTVTVAATGSEALEAAETMEPDLVLMDLRMPVMDGFEAMRRLRAGGFARPVIAVSAEINPDIERLARDAGADGVAAKPLDAEALRRLALRWTGRPGAVAGAA